MSLNLQTLTENVGAVVKGKPDAIRYTTICLISGGHVLLEDVPGVGKTILAQAMAKSFQVQFQRIQFTPDLLPSDVTGLTVFDQRTQEFEFHQGPVFANVLLADEINRATPRTQSSLLEAMNEAQVTVDQTTRQLPQPFFVIATQNPVEFQGTFPLPEAQLDRFLMRISIGYPAKEDEKEILRSQQGSHPIEKLKAVATTEELVALQQSVKDTHLSEEVLDYLVTLVKQTREETKIKMGISTRGSLALMRASQGAARFAGRDYVTPDDIQEMALPVLAHRLILHQQQLGGQTQEDVVEELLNAVPVPH